LDEQASKHKAAIVLKNSDAMEDLSAGPCTADMQIAWAEPLLMQKKTHRRSGRGKLKDLLTGVTERFLGYTHSSTQQNLSDGAQSSLKCL